MSLTHDPRARVIRRYESNREKFVEKFQHEGGRSSIPGIPAPAFPPSLFLSPNRRERLLAAGRDDDVLGPSLQTFEQEDEETVVGIFECTPPAHGIETRVMEEEKYSSRKWPRNVRARRELKTTAEKNQTNSCYLVQCPFKIY